MLVKARDYLHYDVDKLFDEFNHLKKTIIDLEMDDGLIKVPARCFILSWLSWNHHRKYPKTRLIKRHVLTKELIGKDDLLKLWGVINFDCFDDYDQQLNLDELAQDVYETYNYNYNILTYKLERYVSSSCILDYLAVAEHPDIVKANSEVLPTQASIHNVYKTIKNVLFNDPVISKIPKVISIRAGLDKIDQYNQIIGPRGFLTDQNSLIFPNPILSGYFDGIVSLHDTAIESRSGTKANMFTKIPLQKTETFNREQQLVANVIKYLKQDDCGTDKLIKWVVGHKDLGIMDGIFYMGNKGELVELKASDTHLIGETIYIRNPLTCESYKTHRYGVCKKCYGTLSYSIPYAYDPDWSINSNIGHISATQLCGPVSQKTLSTKHYDGSSETEPVKIGPLEAEFIEQGDDLNKIALKSKYQGKNVKLLIPQFDALSLPDIETEDIKNLSLSKISALSKVDLQIEEDDSIETIPLHISIGSRLATMSRDLLEHVKNTGYGVNKNQKYIVDLSKWDCNKNLFELPLKHKNMLDFMTSIESFVKGAKNSLKKKDRNIDMSDLENVSKVLMEFNDLVSTELRVHISHISIILAATLVQDVDSMNFDLPVNAEQRQLGPFKRIMENRSLGAGFAYQGHLNMITNPLSFLNKDIPASEMDYLILGTEAE